MLINGQPANTEPDALLQQLSALDSSFPEYISGKPPYFPHPEVYSLCTSGQQFLTQKQPKEALEQFQAAATQIPTDQPNPFLGNVHFSIASAQQELGNYSEAAQSFAKSADIQIESKNYFGAEETYKSLAQMHFVNGTIEQYEQETQELLNNSLSSKDQTQELSARLALGAINRARGHDVEALEQYAISYDLQQGKIDYEAVRVEQHEVGFSDQKIGTDNIQQCVAVILHDPITKKTALAHVDKFTDTSSLSSVIANFPKGTKLNAYLVGGRDRSPQSKAVSDDNIARVMGELQKHTEVDIKSADIGDKGAPSGIIFDPQTAELKHAVPGKQHKTTPVRKLLLHASTPALRFAFDLTKSEDMPKQDITDIDKKSLIQRYLSTPKTANSQEAWSASLIYEPLAKVTEQIRQENPQIVQEVLTGYVDYHLSRNTTLKSEEKQTLKDTLLSETKESLKDSTKSFVQIEQDLNKKMTMSGIALTAKQLIPQNNWEKFQTEVIKVIDNIGKAVNAFGASIKKIISKITDLLTNKTKKPDITIVTTQVEHKVEKLDITPKDPSIQKSVEQFRQHHQNSHVARDLPQNPQQQQKNTGITR